VVLGAVVPQLKVDTALRIPGLGLGGTWFRVSGTSALGFGPGQSFRLLSVVVLNQNRTVCPSLGVECCSKFFEGF